MSDLIDRQAAIDAIESHIRTAQEPYVLQREDEIMNYAFEVSASCIYNLPSAEPEWIPVKTRPMDEEERAYWSEHLGYDIEYEDAVMFDCKMPDDGQEILVSFRKWISMDKCEIDGGLYGLEGNGDWDGVVAWMPLPKPWKDGVE